MAESPLLKPKTESDQRERAESGADLLASLTKEAQSLKDKLEEEKRKLYDADRKENVFLQAFLLPGQMQSCV